MGRRAAAHAGSPVAVGEAPHLVAPPLGMRWIAEALNLPPLALFGIGKEAVPKGERGRLLGRINATLSGMNDEQLARAARIMEAFVGQ